MKKLLLTFFSAFFLMTASAEVVQGTCDGVNWTYDTNEYVLTISVAEGNTEGKMADHKKADTEWHKYVLETYGSPNRPKYYYISDDVAKVIIQEGVTHIGNYAFSGFGEYFTEVVFPSTLKTIGGHAFDGSMDLTTVSGHAENVTSVGSNAFNGTSVLNNGCLQLGTILFEAKEAEGALNFTGKGITRIADGAFQGNTKVTSIVFDESLKAIGKNAFNGCENLTTLDFPNTVETFGVNAFLDCTSLSVVGDYRMAGNYVIVAVVDTDNAKYIVGDEIIYVAESAFSSCTESPVVCFESTEAPLAGQNAFSSVSRFYVADGYEQYFENKLNAKGKVNTTEVKFGGTGFATVALRHSAKIPVGVKAYRATINSDLKVAYEEVTGNLAAGKGYVLEGGVHGTYNFEPARVAVEDNAENHMVGVLENTVLKGNHIYLLSLYNGKVGFRSLLEATQTLGAGKAYLDSNLSPYNVSAVDFMNFCIGGNTTDIDAVTATQSNTRANIYNVSGQQLSAPRKGLNIVNGKVIYF